jgi:hypothetical protein
MAKEYSWSGKKLQSEMYRYARQDSQLNCLQIWFVEGDALALVPYTCSLLHPDNSANNILKNYSSSRNQQ